MSSRDAGLPATRPALTAVVSDEASGTPVRARTTRNADIVCLSHLRWDFVFQRPQHLMSRAARDRRVFYLEPPVGTRHPDRYLLKRRPDGLSVVVPALPRGMERPRRTRSAEEARMDALARRIDDLIASEGIRDFVLWYYTPHGIPAARHLEPMAVVYDCMDELSTFKGALKSTVEYEEELFQRADVVFTGGRSLYEAKRDHHPDVHAFPSSVDVRHFAQAREGLADPPDQARIAGPRLGYFGVIDERMDMQLVQGIAEARPDWQLVLVGPIAKIGRSKLARGPNIHYLGKKAYEELPAYLAGWDVAIMPFARNDATRFISPTKTPEYLAAGKPVVSTSIRDVVHPYGAQGLVSIADTRDGFVDAAERALLEDPEPRIRRVDRFLRRLSWDETWVSMDELVQQAIERRVAGDPPVPVPAERPVPVAAAGDAKRVVIPVRPPSLPPLTVVRSPIATTQD